MKAADAILILWINSVLLLLAAAFFMRVSVVPAICLAAVGIIDAWLAKACDDAAVKEAEEVNQYTVQRRGQ
jgi:hypothetical protein